MRVSAVRIIRKAVRRSPPSANRSLPASSSEPDYFAGIEQILRIERTLDRTHHRHGIAVLRVEKIELADADAVLAGRSHVQGERKHHDGVIDGFVFGEVFFTGLVLQVQEVEISDAD